MYQRKRSQGNQRAERGKVENNTLRAFLYTRLIRHSRTQSTTQLFLSRLRLYLYQPKSYPNTINPLLQSLALYLVSDYLPTGLGREHRFLRHVNPRSFREKESI